MALIKCQECGKEISDSSKVCIHCGYKLKSFKICPECNTQVDENDTTCSKCGYSFKRTDKKERKLTIIISIIVGIILIGIITFFIISSKYVEVPNLTNTDSLTATEILRNDNLIPRLEYEYSDEIEEGNVIYLSKKDKVKKNSSIIVVVSKGPKTIYSKNSTINWWSVGNGSDSWSFNNPRIDEEYLYIDCEATFATSFTFKGEGDNNNGFGNASINDTFSKTVPVTIILDNRKVTANSKKEITLKISIKDLDVQKPTTLYTRLVGIYPNGNEFNINVNFSISW